MKATEVTIKEMMKGDKVFISPSFQRPYDWRGDAVKRTIASMMGNSENFIGAIVAIHLNSNTKSTCKRFLTIDGHHRLFTILIVILAIRDSLNNFSSSYNDEINHTFLINFSSHPSSKVLMPKRDRATFESLIFKKPISSKASPILRVYKYAMKQLKNTPEDILSLYLERIVYNSSIIFISLDMGEDPYPIFKLLSVPSQEYTKKGLHEYNRFSDDPEIMSLISGGESNDVEFKERTINNDKNKYDITPSYSILKCICGFMNSTCGGTLLIGIRDDGYVLGIDNEYHTIDRGKNNRDGYLLFINNTIRMRLNTENIVLYYKTEIRRVQNHDICIITVSPSKKPVYLDKHLYVRAGNQTIEMQGPDLVNYVNTRFA